MRTCLIFAIFCLSFPLLSAPSLEPPKLRLDGSAAPLRYAIDLTIVPDRDTFQATADISLEVHGPSEILWLNAIGLQIQEADFRPESGASLPARTVPGGDQFLGFGFDRPISGKGVLHVSYQGKISRISNAGVFQLKEDNEWYVYSQFEPTDARRAFPCFR